jgi:glutamate/tyrosine decarboxylase-like PLP-dependent enzyme
MDADAAMSPAPDPLSEVGCSLDPADWSAARALGHRMLDDVFDDLQGLREQPVWRPMPDAVRGAWHERLPRGPSEPAAVYAAYRTLIAPYATGNRHPRFMGWVHGGGTVVGMLAEMLAGGLNANLGGRDHAPIGCEQQVIRWAAEMLGFPTDASGLLVTGTSMANLIAVLVARTASLGPDVRPHGIGRTTLAAYASAGVHGCVGRALDIAGIGSDALRLIACGADGGMDVSDLRRAIAADRAAGHRPFLVVGTAGSVDTGAIDDLTGIERVCVEHGLWFHVDAAYAAIAMLSPVLRPLLRGIEWADSVAFDFHKWAQVPYDAGCIVVRDARQHRAAFESPAAYLRREARGLAGGSPWPCDFGPDLSRGFRALKVWMTFAVYGADQLGRVAEHTCALARHLAERVGAEPLLELAAPVMLNIVCFRYRHGDDAVQAEIVADLQEAGIAAPSTTTIAGRTVVRAAIVNHRTQENDVDALVDAVIAAGRRRCPGEPVEFMPSGTGLVRRSDSVTKLEEADDLKLVLEDSILT